MNTNGRASVVSAVAVAVILTIGFLSLRFIPPSPRFVVGFPDSFAENTPVLRGPKDHPVLVVKKTGRVFSLDPACPPPGFAPATSPACRLEWKPTDQVLACPCDPSATYDAEGRAIASGRPSVIRFRTTLGPNGEVMVDRSVTFDQKDWLKPGAELFLVPPVQAAGGM